MKKCICLILSVIMLLTLCACSGGNDVETNGTDHTQPMESTAPSQTAATDDAEASTKATQPEKETEATTEATEPGFAAITIFDDPKYGTVQLTDIVFDYGGYVAVFTVTNSADGTLFCEIGKAVYFNDVMYSPIEFEKMHSSRSYSIEIEEGQQETIERVLPFRWLDEATVDMSVKVTYDNGETGAYQERIDLVNNVFRIYTGENAVSKKYVPSGAELFAADSEAYQLIATACGENTKSSNEKYWVSLYLEYTSDHYVIFAFEDFVSVSSDRQDNPYYLASSGSYFLDFRMDRITLAPGKGCSLVASVSKDKVDGYAVDASEIVTVKIPVSVWDYPSDHLAAGELDYSWKEDHVITVTRDQLVNGN